VCQVIAWASAVQTVANPGFLCRGADEQPVFITRNGKGDMVVMSQAHYEKLRNKIGLYQKLGEAEALDAGGEQRNPCSPGFPA
jgi:prevent-host-death family protein